MFKDADGVGLGAPARPFASSAGGGFGVDVVPEPSFAVELVDSLVPHRGLGSRTPTYARTTSIVIPCFAAGAVAGDPLLWIEVPANEAAFWGARRVSAGVWSRFYADGSAIPRSICLGYYEDVSSRAQILNSAKVRDLTDGAYWVASSVTVAKDAVGADGVAASASTLTATGPNGTVLRTVTAAAALRRFFCLVRRKTGTGTILLKQSGTTVDITSLINSSTYTMVSVRDSILNVQVGFQIATSGDAIEVDYCNFILSTVEDYGCPIGVGVGTSTGGKVTYPQSGNAEATIQRGTIACRAMRKFVAGVGRTVVQVGKQSAPQDHVAELANGDSTNYRVRGTVFSNTGARELESLVAGGLQYDVWIRYGMRWDMATPYGDAWKDAEFGSPDVAFGSAVNGSGVIAVQGPSFTPLPGGSQGVVTDVRVWPVKLRDAHVSGGI